MSSYSIKRTGDLIQTSFKAEVTTEDLEALKADIVNLSSDHPHNILVDLSAILGDGELPTNLDTFFDDLPYRRYAIFGAKKTAALRTKSLLESLPEHPNLKFFHQEEDARAWLNPYASGKIK